MTSRAPGSRRLHRPWRTPPSRRGRWRRSRLARLGAALLAGTAVWVVAAPLLPQHPERGRPVVVAAHDLPIGTALTVDDLEVQRVDESVGSAGALSRVEEAAGHVTSGPILAGEMVTLARFRGPGQLSGLSAGHVAVSVPVADAGLLGSLRPADQVSLLVVGSGDTVAKIAVVLAVQPSSSGLLGQTGSSGDHLVLALTSDEARAVAAAMGVSSAPGAFVVALRG